MREGYYPGNSGDRKSAFIHSHYRMGPFGESTPWDLLCRRLTEGGNRFVVAPDGYFYTLDLSRRMRIGIEPPATTVGRNRLVLAIETPVRRIDPLQLVLSSSSVTDTLVYLLQDR